MSHTAELIAVGTELLLGSIANTDAQMLSQGLSALGINVYYHTVVGDNPQRLRAAVELARTRADIIITTGGLEDYPTHLAEHEGAPLPGSIDIGVCLFDMNVGLISIWPFSPLLLL